MKRNYLYDAFISYASEDRRFAMALAKELKQLGVKVWIDKFLLKIGDKISLKIGEGMAKSRYGIILLSPNFLKKDCPKHELSGLIDKAISANNLLPIWHGITKDEIKNFHPAIADIFAVKSEIGVKNVALELARIIQPKIIKLISFKKVKISEIKQGPIRHSDLPKNFLERIKLFKKKISEVENSSLEDTINGFKRDLHPGREIRVWEAIAGVYDNYVSARSLLSLEQKKEIFSTILLVSLGKLEEDYFKNLKYLSKETARKLEKNYRILLTKLIKLDSFN